MVVFLLNKYRIIVGIFVMFIFWFFLYKRIASFFEKCISTYSSHKFKLPEVNVFNSLISGLFCFISVPLCFSSFKPSNVSDVPLIYWLIDSFTQMLERCAITETVDPSRNFKFIILYSCLLHSFYMSFSNHLNERPVFTNLIKKGSILGFFASTYCFGCTEAGFVLLGLSNLSLGTLEVARLLKVWHNRTHSMVIKILCFMQFIVHCVIWIFIYLFLIPFIVLSSIEVLTVNDGNHHQLIVMLSSILVFYLTELKNSPLNMSTTSGNGIFRLFESPKDTLEAAKKRPQRKTKENLSVLYQTTKCAMAVKKKLHKIRQDKQPIRLLSASEIKSEPIDVIEIFDD